MEEDGPYCGASGFWPSWIIAPILLVTALTRSSAMTLDFQIEKAKAPKTKENRRIATHSGLSNLPQKSPSDIRIRQAICRIQYMVALLSR